MGIKIPEGMIKVTALDSLLNSHRDFSKEPTVREMWGSKDPAELGRLLEVLRGYHHRNYGIVHTLSLLRLRLDKGQKLFYAQLWAKEGKAQLASAEVYFGLKWPEKKKGRSK